MADRMEQWGDSLIQHGPASDRIYLMELAPQDCPAILDDLDKLAAERHYGKIFAKAPATTADAFLARGYREEAHIPAMFQGTEAGFFFGKFLRPERAIEPHPGRIQNVLSAARLRSGSGTPPLKPEYIMRTLQAEDAPQAAALYRAVFDSYPFPIQDPAYLCETMDSHVRYAGVWHGEKLAALSSAEIFASSGHAEMTDFATLPDYRGHGFAGALLEYMESIVREEGVGMAYTIARAYSYGMNIAFARNAYEYGGTLCNNTQICGCLESMNVWYKPLSSAQE